jgi:ribosomal protein S2
MADAQSAPVAETLSLAEGQVQYFERFDFDRVDTSIESLLKAGVHFGHLKSRRHPRMEPFVFTTRKNISILNLEKTKETLETANAFLRSVAKSGKPVLFVGIKKQTHDAVQSLAKRLGMPFVTDRWLGGTRKSAIEPSISARARRSSRSVNSRSTPSSSNRKSPRNSRNSNTRSAD